MNPQKRHEIFSRMREHIQKPRSELEYRSNFVGGGHRLQISASNSAPCGARCSLVGVYLLAACCCTIKLLRLLFNLAAIWITFKLACNKVLADFWRFAVQMGVVKDCLNCVKELRDKGGHA